MYKRQSDYFPMPQDFIVDRLSNTVSDSQTAKERRTAVKERMYVKMRDLKNIIDDPEICGKVYPYVKQYDKQQLRASIESVTHRIEGLETKLYTVPRCV